MKSLYFLVDFLTVIIPFLFSFHPKINFYRNHKTFLIANSVAALVFILWDIIFTSQKVWGFNPHYISGIYLYNLPIEEILFFFCIPYSCLFTYNCLNLFFNLSWKLKTEKIFIAVFAGLMFVTGIYFYSYLYTSVTFISTAFLLLLLKFGVKVNWLGKFLSVYPILLIPFFIVNGILTGTGIQEPVVWYNNNQNLGIRLHTIPVEDIIYGFELMLLNIFIYEKLKERKS